MRLIELRGPDAAHYEAAHDAWQRRAMRWKRALRALWIALQPIRARRQPVKRLEFYAEAGAPEGALYVDGKLSATLDGVTRL